MKYLPIALIASSIIIAATTIAFASRKSQTRSPVSIDSIHIVGDSQTLRHIGQAFQREFSPRIVTYYGKEGAHPSEYLTSPSILEQSLPTHCPDLIYIQLGDNGIRSSAVVVQLINFYRERCPASKIVWGGPMQAVQPTIPSIYVSNDPDSPRYLPAYNQMRAIWNARAAEGAEQTNSMFFDNFTIQDEEPLESPFSNRRGGDGIHLSAEAAAKHASLFRNFLSEYNLSVTS